MFPDTEDALGASFAEVDPNVGKASDGLEFPQDGYQLHYQNCYAFLGYLHAQLATRQPELAAIPNFKLVAELDEFDRTVDYGKQYHELMLGLYQYFKEERTEYSDAEYALLTAIFTNQNANFERAHAATHDLLPDTKQTNYKAWETAAFAFAQNNTQRLPAGSVMPYQRGAEIATLACENFGGRLWDYRPQTTTNMPSQSPFQPMQDGSTLLRMGTQSERVRGVYQINPLLKAWLAAKAQWNPGSKNPTLLYFNLLHLEDSGFKDIEVQCSKQLIDFAKDQTKVAVISLPADSGLLNTENINKGIKQGKIKLSSVAEKLLDVIRDKGDGYGGTDCYISPEIREKLFPRNSLDAEIKRLWGETCEELGFTDQKRKISAAQEVALAFHFYKYTLPNYIINILGPEYICMVCKDGIDRGGVALAYFTLIQSIRNEEPLTQKQFQTLLHGPALQTKARPVNKHILYIWQAMNVLQQTSTLTKPDWLRGWVSANQPDAAVLAQEAESELPDELAGKIDAENVRVGMDDDLRLHLLQQEAPKGFAFESFVKTSVVANSIATNIQLLVLGDKYKGLLQDQRAMLCKYLVHWFFKQKTTGEQQIELLTQLSNKGFTDPADGQAFLHDIIGDTQWWALDAEKIKGLCQNEALFALLRKTVTSGATCSIVPLYEAFLDTLLRRQPDTFNNLYRAASPEQTAQLVDFILANSERVEHFKPVMLNPPQVLDTITRLSSAHPSACQRLLTEFLKNNTIDALTGIADTADKRIALLRATRSTTDVHAQVLTQLPRLGQQSVDDLDAYIRGLHAAELIALAKSERADAASDGTIANVLQDDANINALINAHYSGTPYTDVEKAMIWQLACALRGRYCMQQAEVASIFAMGDYASLQFRLQHSYESAQGVSYQRIDGEQAREYLRENLRDKLPENFSGIYVRQAELDPALDAHRAQRQCQYAALQRTLQTLRGVRHVLDKLGMLAAEQAELNAAYQEFNRAVFDLDLENPDIKNFATQIKPAETAFNTHMAGILQRRGLDKPANKEDKKLKRKSPAEYYDKLLQRYRFFAGLLDPALPVVSALRVDDVTATDAGVAKGGFTLYDVAYPLTNKTDKQKRAIRTRYYAQALGELDGKALLEVCFTDELRQDDRALPAQARKWFPFTLKNSYFRHVRIVWNNLTEPAKDLFYGRMATPVAVGEKDKPALTEYAAENFRQAKMNVGLIRKDLADEVSTPVILTTVKGKWNPLRLFFDNNETQMYKHTTRAVQATAAPEYVYAPQNGMPSSEKDYLPDGYEERLQWLEGEGIDFNALPYRARQALRAAASVSVVRDQRTRKILYIMCASGQDRTGNVDEYVIRIFAKDTLGLSQVLVGGGLFDKIRCAMNVQAFLSSFMAPGSPGQKSESEPKAGLGRDFLIPERIKKHDRSRERTFSEGYVNVSFNKHLTGTNKHVPVGHVQVTGLTADAQQRINDFSATQRNAFWQKLGEGEFNEAEIRDVFASPQARAYLSHDLISRINAIPAAHQHLATAVVEAIFVHKDLRQHWVRDNFVAFLGLLLQDACKTMAVNQWLLSKPKLTLGLALGVLAAHQNLPPHAAAALFCQSLKSLKTFEAKDQLIQKLAAHCEIQNTQAVFLQAVRSQPQGRKFLIQKGKQLASQTAYDPVSLLDQSCRSAYQEYQANRPWVVKALESFARGMSECFASASTNLRQIRDRGFSMGYIELPEMHTTHTPPGSPRTRGSLVHPVPPGETSTTGTHSKPSPEQTHPPAPPSSRCAIL